MESEVAGMENNGNNLFNQLCNSQANSMKTRKTTRDRVISLKCSWSHAFYYDIKRQQPKC